MTRFSLIACLVLLLPAPAAAQQPNCGNPPIMLIIQDRSGSMSSYSKWSHAKNAINTLVTKYAGAIHFSLMLFPGPGGSCNAGQINVPVGANNVNQIKSTLNSSSPTGMTPMHYSLRNAHNYLNGMSGSRARYALLVSDGMPNCSGDPKGGSLIWVNNMRAAGIKTYVVGFGSGVDASLLNSLANAGGTARSGGTKYYQANNASQLTSALSSIGSMVSCCGNGKLDAGEKCDKAIPAGGKGACPRSALDCDDYKPCTNDYASGSECNVVCAHSPVTVAKHNDKCCPPGANANSDNDCSAACGNGVLEAGEGCDPGIKSGAGTCKTPADCDDKDPCTKDTVGGNACQITCQYAAVGPDTSKKDGCCPKGMSNELDADCLPPCGPDMQDNCINVCKDVKCPTGFYCYKGKCISKGGSGSDAGTIPTEDPDGGMTTNETETPGNNGQGNMPVDGFIGGEGCACEMGRAPEGSGALTLLAGIALLGLLVQRRRRR